jgi:hypothetical protein
MKKAKQVIALLIAVIMMLALTACGSTNELASIKSTVAVGNIIEFGAYEQDNDMSNGKEPIEWLVLERDGNKILVISKYALDAQPYNDNDEFDTTWERCTLRTWMNGTFFKEAFNIAERKMIQTTLVTADKYPKYDTDPGNDTNDKIFLLSRDEVDNKYFTFTLYGERKCVPTAYAKARFTWTYAFDAYTEDGETTCHWWLRSPGKDQFRAAKVGIHGDTDNVGDFVLSGACVRPAMWIDLDA